ncbi:hypothetical protein GCM10010197_34010 [Nocardioides luteus]|uniref:Uncharacterized protein n=1 Tax=Nocardioides luteus TaxID=1844 RepID=A0ABQ5T2F8_9ACTN|nr:hypothetical protein GCM10010197_34010 [Nocardioides luteus]GLJ70434.1 hypothetical protein GCM10017579_44700 [Nocardioides luteus]
MVSLAGLKLGDELVGGLHPKLGVFDSLEAAYGCRVDVARQHVWLVGRIYMRGLDFPICYSVEVVLKVVRDEQLIEAVTRSEV